MSRLSEDVDNKETWNVTRFYVVHFKVCAKFMTLSVCSFLLTSMHCKQKAEVQISTAECPLDWEGLRFYSRYTKSKPRYFCLSFYSVIFAFPTCQTGVFSNRWRRSCSRGEFNPLWRPRSVSWICWCSNHAYP